MTPAPEAVLVATVAAVGVLHTMVPDHWAPIAALARSRGWSRQRTAWAAALAGVGHVSSTLVLGAAAWAVGLAAAAHFGNFVNRIAALALVAFGAWIALGAWNETREESSDDRSHAHLHRHEDGTEHVHWHAHGAADWHAVEGGAAVLHRHGHALSGRTALLLIVGSSPMVEGLPAFFAAASYGAGTLAAMAAAFAGATILTYVVLSTAALRGLERMKLGRFERYGEVLSGGIVACVGVLAFLFS